MHDRYACLRGFATAGMLGILALSDIASAQIVPDTTLPNPSRVNLEGQIQRISGGTLAGGNLFHSFDRFDLPTGETAFFDNAVAVENVITRVTGGQLSNIDGLIRANGSANLFLINPSGMVFGANARLEIGGSFFGSTADSLVFADGSSYSATQPNAPPLLTVNVPIGLQLGANPGAIRVEGAGHGVRQGGILLPLVRGNLTAGLRVAPGRTLALVGGDLTFVGGVVAADSGRIELGGVAGGRVGLSSAPLGWTLDYAGVETFRDLRLSEQSIADASGIGSGSIQARGQQIVLEDGSLMLVQNQGGQPAGSIRAIASASIEAFGLTPDGTTPSGLRTETLGTGRGGDIEIFAPRLMLREGGTISPRTFGSASSGNLSAIAPKSIEILGFSTLNPSFVSTMNVTTLGTGDTGNFDLATDRLVALNGGGIIVATFAVGNSGDLTVKANEIELDGVVPNIFTPSLLTSVSAGHGDGGNLTIDTARLIVRNGGRVDASTIGRGEAGSLTIRARESVIVSGTVPGAINPSLISSSGNIVDKTLQQLFGLPDRPTGNSGGLRIETPMLEVADGALVNVRHDGSGNAGTLSIEAEIVRLDKGGEIAATTRSGEGGNLDLHVRNTLQVRDRSQISATAGGTGNGGNIQIETPTLVAWENSDISANAGRGEGGGVTISAQGIFGTAFRDRLTPESDITASSDLGAEFSGTVTLNTPDIDASAGLVELHVETTDRGDRVVSTCGAADGSTFAIIGRGGISPEPTDLLHSEMIWEDLRNFTGSATVPEMVARVASPQENNRPSFAAQPQRELVEATGWIVREDGTVELVAEGGESGSRWGKIPPCQPLSMT